jgi:ferredoxin
MTVSIDEQRCFGHGRCYETAPELFGDDCLGYGIVKGDGQVEPGQIERAKLAARLCPERAVLFTESSAGSRNQGERAS